MQFLLTILQSVLSFNAFLQVSKCQYVKIMPIMRYLIGPPKSVEHFPTIVLFGAPFSVFYIPTTRTTRTS